ncbi:MAG: GNVR domain-containing protein, partial [Salinimicrobium sp.]
MMVLDDEDKNVVGALPSGGASILAIGDNSLDNQIVTLQSKSLVSEVIEELDLNISYFFEGKVIAIEAYKDAPIVLKFLSNENIANYLDVSLTIIPQSNRKYELIIDDYDYSAVEIFGEPVKVGDAEFIISKRPGTELRKSKVTIEIQPLREVVDSFISRMTVKPMGKAEDILSLSISGEVPEKSQDFLNALMFHFNEEGVADKRQVAESTANFIQERLELISQELDSVETGMAEFKRENQIMNVESSAGQYLAKSSQAEQQIFDLETQRLVLNGIEETLSSAKPYQLLPEGMGIESGNITSGTSKYNELVLERNTYLKSGTTENPVVETITEQLDDLRQNLLKNIDQVKSTLLIKLRELNQLDQKAEGQFSTFPGLEKGIRGIVRQQQIKEQLYLFLLQRREESAISSAATSPVIKVIDPAWTYDEPVDPKPWLIMAGGGIIGFFVPLLIIFGVNFLDTKVHHKG